MNVMQIDVEINAPVEKVFALLTKKENFPNWWRGFIRLDYAGVFNSENPIGSKFHLEYRTGFRRDRVNVDCEVIGYKPNELYSFKTMNRFGNGEAIYKFSFANGKTKLTSESSFSSPIKILMPFVALAKWDLRFHAKRNLERLKKLAEEN